MVEVDFNVNLRLKISEELDFALQDGSPTAFAALEELIQTALNGAGTECSKIQILDAGPHNTTWKE